MSDLLNDNTKDGSVIPVRFTRLYITMLIILAILLTIGQGLTQWRLRAVQDEIWITRYTALQRHQSQQIVKQALQLADSDEQADFSENIADLRQVFPVFERYHLLGRQGRADNPKVVITNSDTVQQLYEAIRPEFDAIRQSARRLMRLQNFDEIRKPDVQSSLKLLLANEKPFLEEIDGIVRVYNSEVRSKLTLLQSLAFYLYLSTIMTLVAIGVLIFRPASRKLKQTFAQLVEAESQTTAANKKLLSANKSLKETRQKLFEATKLQYQQQMDDQKLRTSYLIAGQEEERKRLSRELHDGLGQMLTAIKLQIEGLEAGLLKAAASEQNSPIAYPKNLKTLKGLVTQTIQETRTISNNLMPTVLSDFGAVPALKMLAENNRSETIDVTFETNLTTDKPRLDKNVEITLYRVTQEAVSNAVKHANPSHIHIDLKERGNILQLEINDDGKGFVVPRKKQTSGLMKPKEETKSDQSIPIKLRPPSQGLHNIQERTKLLNGKFKINSMIGKGTRILVTIPYQTHFAHHGTY
ncbi:sensor histidine kinase [Spirosoma validum]|uniref:histidine kinase n=1 Tax=Spirosoma validum TaxID=2771355 RepID=A0A927B1B6_9BACT|nr:sensor histidine kinase [Spirosoma validum]MBD2753598.1 type IV pili methyl-accepting chemotaxis transducer N-terminal domain-containing protein [Spirosoma validum]